MEKFAPPLNLDDIPIHANHISRNFGKTRALKDIDLTIGAASNITAILGANGAGKSTFINCALGLTRPSKGKFSIFGHKAGTMAARRRIGVMLQDANLPDGLTPREHLTLFASYYPAPLNVDQVLSMCALQDFANKAYGKLSGGQKRRVQFAVSIIGRPDLVFLDEPTTGLDMEARRGLWRIVHEFSENGSHVILTTHYLEEAESLADRIVVLNKGTVIADGTTDEIRGATAGAMIRCITSLSLEKIQQLTAVRRVRMQGQHTEILSSHQTHTLSDLLQHDPEIKDLTVSKPNLEEAFLDLIQSREEGVQ